MSGFDNLGDETTAKGKEKGDGEDSDDKEKSRRSLEKDFEDVAAKYPDELE